eukprot:scaffold107269_cov34-Tisochrysis_lutea.AAC.6
MDALGALGARQELLLAVVGPRDAANECVRAACQLEVAIEPRDEDEYRRGALQAPVARRRIADGEEVCLDAERRREDHKVEGGQPSKEARGAPDALPERRDDDHQLENKYGEHTDREDGQYALSEARTAVSPIIAAKHREVLELCLVLGPCRIPSPLEEDG